MPDPRAVDAVPASTASPAAEEGMIQAPDTDGLTEAPVGERVTEAPGPGPTPPTVDADDGPTDVAARALTEAPATASADRGQPSPRASGLALACERLLDGAVVVLATWTVVYHLCLVLRLGAAWAVVGEVAALVGVASLARRGRLTGPGEREGASPAQSEQVDDGLESVAIRSTGRDGSGSGLRGRLLVLAGATALVTAAVVALSAPWPVIAGLWLVAAVAGTSHAFLGARGETEPTVEGASRSGNDTMSPAREGRGVTVALVWAAGLAALSMFTRWPNPDDLYYVNLSQWVAEHGTYPVRDTIFSDLVFPMSSWPPIASYDALAGTLAWVTGVHAASVVYLVVPPVVTFLSVLALWRLQRQWRIQAVGVAVSVALVFLLFDGGLGYAAPGNLFLTRIWQGKVILLCLMVPLLVVYALRYIEAPTRARARWLFAGGVAAVGLSTTAMFLVPMLAVAGAAPLVRDRPRRALVGGLAMAAYPLAAGAATLALGGRSADDFDSRRLFRFEPSWFGPQILRDGVVAAVLVTAVLLAAVALPHRAARQMSGVLAIVVGITFVPGVTDVAFDLVGLGPTLWRVSWVLTAAALVGAVAAHLASRGDRRLRLIVPAALVVALVAFGQPIFTGDVGVAIDSTPQWKRPPDTVEAAEELIAAADPGDVVLAPRELAITITVLTTEVKTVAPRAYFMDYLSDEPGFGYEERLTLIAFADGETDTSDLPEVIDALDVLDVDEVCLSTEAARAAAFVQAQGYTPLAETAGIGCFGR